MYKVKFFSENDISCVMSIERIIQIVTEYDDEVELDIECLLEFHNIIKFLKIQEFRKQIEKDVKVDLNNFIRKIEKKIGEFIANRKNNYLKLYELIHYPYRKDFFEVLDKYKIYQFISGEKLQGFMTKYRTMLYNILGNKNLVHHYDDIIKTVLLDNPNNAEIVLDKYLSEKNLFLPLSLNLSEIEILIDLYLDLEHLNLNYLRKIIYFPLDTGLIISDKLKLKAKRRLKIEEERITEGKLGLEMGAEISYSDNQEEAVQLRVDGAIVKYSIQKKWITDNLDFNTLWNNFIYIFHFFDEQIRLSLVSKTNEAGILERILSDNGKHIYKEHDEFKIKGMCSYIQLISYSELLNLNGIRIEDMIEWFFSKYLKDEFNIIGFIIKMPSEHLTYFEKCRTILPEIDRILKQYNAYVENGGIDHELLQISSKPMLFSNYISMVQNKYIYPASPYYYDAVNRLYSDQSSLSFITYHEVTYDNFCDLLSKEKVRLNDFEHYQKVEIMWLIDNGLLAVDENGYILIKDVTEVTILGDLFYNDVISYWNLPLKIKHKIDNWVSNGILMAESSLLSKYEQDYIDYYLNKRKFTNGYDLRNRYAHGTHSNDEKQHKFDYYIFLRMIIILVVKINDDLCCFEKYKDMEA